MGYLLVKRVLDLSLSLVLLGLLSPVLLTAAILVKLSSPGPVLYKGKRSGKNGIPFLMLKFRTMRLSPPETLEGTTGLNDPRVTTVGRVIRKIKFDELPQLLNVLKGEMSLVGPRPELPRYTDWYSLEEKLILSVSPGITDFSSIALSSLDELVGSDNVDRNFEEKVLPIKNKLRLKYVREKSLKTDIYILFLTLITILRKITPKKIKPSDQQLSRQF